MTADPIVFQRRPRPNEVLPDPRTLVLMGQELMTRLISCFVSQGVVAPDRQIVYMMPIPADCEQVAVLFSGWNPLPPWDTLTHCDSFRWVASYSIGITRCTPALPTKAGKVAPTPDQMLQAAQIASQDAEVLLCLVASLGEIGSELSVVTAAPSGGFQTVEVNLSIPAVGGLD
jgi:hypothetical protein